MSIYTKLILALMMSVGVSTGYAQTTLTTSDYNKPGGVPQLDSTGALTQKMTGSVDSATVGGAPLSYIIPALTAQNRLAGYVAKSDVGQPNGVAPLDSSGNLTSPGLNQTITTPNIINPTINGGTIALKTVTCQNTAACILSSLISYSPGWAQAKERTLLSRLEDTVSATDFGADPSGTNDSSVAINNALSASGHVLLPCGTYSLKSAVTLINGVTLEGYGQCSVLRLDTASAVGVSANGASKINLKNIAITKTTDRSVDDIMFNTVTDGVIQNVIDVDTGHIAAADVHLTGVTRVKVSSSVFSTDSVSGYGIQIDGTTSTGGSNYVKIDDTGISGFLSGIEIQWVSNLTAIGDYVTKAYLAGISIQPDTADLVGGTTYSETGSFMQFAGVVSVGNQGDGWEISGDGTINGIQLSNCAGISNGLLNDDQSYSASGFHLENVNAVGINISNSDFSLNYGNGVYIEGGDSISIVGSSVNNNSLAENANSHGIMVLDQTKNVVIASNVVGYSSAYGMVKNQNWGAYILAVDGVIVSGNIFRGNITGGIYLTTTSSSTPSVINTANVTE